MTEDEKRAEDHMLKVLDVCADFINIRSSYITLVNKLLHILRETLDYSDVIFDQFRSLETSDNTEKITDYTSRLDQMYNEYEDRVRKALAEAKKNG